MMYRFVGTCSHVHLEGAEQPAVTLEHYGQQIELTEEQAASAILQRSALIPEEMFLQAGHTADELKKFHATALHLGAPPSFLEKREKVWGLVREHREKVVAAIFAAEAEAQAKQQAESKE